MTRFKPASHGPLLVGEVPPGLLTDGLPVAHQLAGEAADQAMGEAPEPPDAIVVGTTTGGMDMTEDRLRSGDVATGDFRQHGLGTLAVALARRYRCRGPVLTVSTACSSGVSALALAVALMRAGRAKRVLVGGVDSLCRLTYYGFRSLKLIDPAGARPLDVDRRGLSVAEGAAMCLLETSEAASDRIELMGAGLSCDAFHPTLPHPEGEGAVSAMSFALKGAGLGVGDIDAIHLHGTGTLDNDRVEIGAVRFLFGNHIPPFSSVKGATGHSLAAAGAIGTVMAALAIDRGVIPANVGCRVPDPALGVEPVAKPLRIRPKRILVNAFGFGGNNGAVVVGLGGSDRRPIDAPEDGRLRVAGWSAISGAGMTIETLDRIRHRRSCRGRYPAADMGRMMPSRAVRRVKRLSLMAMSLAAEAVSRTDFPGKIEAVFSGTAWGSLSETYAFLTDLFESSEQFASPTDFIGSVHNASAGQIAIMTGAKGGNLTLTGGNDSFEQALLSAELLAPGKGAVLVVGADEGHPVFSPLFDESVSADGLLSDGGGALVLTREAVPGAPTVETAHIEIGLDGPPSMDGLVKQLGGPTAVKERFGLLLAGIPAADIDSAQDQLKAFLRLTGFSGHRIDYRELTGNYAAASAVAT
ncbi:MAG: beta-ketoacyl synthase N-terminal-like domain-containing protein, partial [Desulfobacterales bacterium]